MSLAKQPVCCARRQGRLTTAKYELARLANKVATLEQRNRPAAKLKERIPEQKRIVEMAQEAIVNHEADHAGAVAL